MQHFRVKVFASNAHVDLGGAIGVFHRWIQQKRLPELIVDVADYRHVPAGPGIVLVGHDSHYSLDLAKNRLGLLYSRRTSAGGSPEDRLRLAFRSAYNVCSALELEPEFSGWLSFAPGELEVSVNDRLLAPNTPAGYDELRPHLRSVLESAFGTSSCRLNSVGEPRELLTVAVTVDNPLPLSEVLRRLG